MFYPWNWANFILALNNATHTLQEINISHLGKRKIIFKLDFSGDMLVPWRVSSLFLTFQLGGVWNLQKNSSLLWLLQGTCENCFPKSGGRWSNISCHVSGESHPCMYECSSNPSVYLSIYLSIHPSIHPSIHLSIYLSPFVHKTKKADISNINQTYSIQYTHNQKKFSWETSNMWTRSQSQRIVE